MPHDALDHDPPRSLLPSDPALKVKTLESLLVGKGLVEPTILDEIIETYQTKIDPQNGAEVLARVWSDKAFRDLMSKDTTPAVSQLEFYGCQGEHIVAVQNTDSVHNLVECTLCSCHPWPLLGISPGWYKSDAYRARAVREPRKVLAEFGVTLSDHVVVQVWDTTAEICFLVVQQRPAGIEEWHARALALKLAAGSVGLWTLHTSRHSRERLLPANYAVFSYYEKWISALGNMLVEHEVISRTELQSAMAHSKPPSLQAHQLTPDKVAKVLSSGDPTECESDKKHHFATGDAVRDGSRQNHMINGGQS